MFSPAAQAPVKRYRTIVADPPWPFTRTLPEKGGGHWLYRADREKRARTSAARYGLMQIEELMNLPVGLWAMDDAHLYLWATNQFMAEAHQIAKAWGFVPKTILTWVKPRLGMGTYFRNNTEHVIFAVRGHLEVLRHDVRTAFTAEQGAHSEKPAHFYDIVQSMSLGPYLDVFARKQRFGWDCWGDKAYCFDDGHAYWHDKAAP
jgi:N6-adenosine-specific RNA methylase IME4